MAGKDAPPETKRRPRVSSISKQVYLFITVLLLACLLVFVVPSFPASGVKVKVSIRAALTGGLLAFTRTRAANGFDSDEKRIRNLSDVDATSVMASSENDPPMVRTSSGVIVGHSAPNRPGVLEFLGIRFGKPPVDELRFAAPQAYTSRDTVSASQFVRWIFLPVHALI